ASITAKKSLGTYHYVHAGDTLSLSRSGIQDELEKVDSYCSVASAAADCKFESLDHELQRRLEVLRGGDLRLVLRRWRLGWRLVVVERIGWFGRGAPHHRLLRERDSPL